MKKFSPPKMKEVSFPTPHTLHPLSSQESVVSKNCGNLHVLRQTTEFGSSLLVMVREGSTNRLNLYLARDLIDQFALDQKQLTKIAKCLSL